MNAYLRYESWLLEPSVDRETKNELLKLQGNQREIEDRFDRDLAFGTGGLRGVMGAGTNRMNPYTVRKATQGLANYLKELGGEPTVVIAYDSRNRSPEFALEAALTLCGNGLRVFLYQGLRSTPQLSYTVRELGCSAGIVITASHNPPEYNGYKVYGPDGGQITSHYAEGISAAIGALELWSDIRSMARVEAVEAGMLHLLEEDIDTRYIERVKGLATRRGTDELKVVYTPLHGTGLMPITRCLGELGYRQVSVVAAQAEPDGNFPSVASPNPEEAEAFTMAIAQAQAEGAHLVLGTDPDCDRVGAAVRCDDGSYALLNGNQVGALLVEYVLSRGGALPVNGAIIKTVVTSDLGAEIARRKGFTVVETLTGFKYIGEKIKEFEETGSHEFLLGYEESYGYLAGTFVRDKDAVIASLLIAEMAAWHQAQGRTLFQALENLHRHYGYYLEKLDAITLKGAGGQATMGAMMAAFREIKRMRSLIPEIREVEDFGNQQRLMVTSGKVVPILLPVSDVLKYHLMDGSWFAIRPSGTEPKIKFYYSIKGDSQEQASSALENLRDRIRTVTG